MDFFEQEVLTEMERFQTAQFLQMAQPVQMAPVPTGPVQMARAMDPLQMAQPVQMTPVPTAGATCCPSSAYPDGATSPDDASSTRPDGADPSGARPDGDPTSADGIGCPTEAPIGPARSPRGKQGPAVDRKRPKRTDSLPASGAPAKRRSRTLYS